MGKGTGRAPTQNSWNVMNLGVCVRAQEGASVRVSMGAAACGWGGGACSKSTRVRWENCKKARAETGRATVGLFLVARTPSGWTGEKETASNARPRCLSQWVQWGLVLGECVHRMITCTEKGHGGHFISPGRLPFLAIFSLHNPMQAYSKISPIVFSAGYS